MTKVLRGSGFLALAHHFGCLLDTPVSTVWVSLLHWDNSSTFLEDGLSVGNEGMVQMIWMSKVLCFDLEDNFFVLFLSHPFTTISDNVAWFFTIMAGHFCLFSVLLVFIWGYGCHCGYC